MKTGVYECPEKIKRIKITIRPYDVVDGEDIPVGFAHVRGIDISDCNSVWEKVKKLQNLMKIVYRILQYLVGVNLNNPHSSLLFKMAQETNPKESSVNLTEARENLNG